MENLSICVSIWYLRWQSPYPLSFPLLVVFCGIKWKMENGKWKMENGKWKMENESKIGRKLFEFRVVFE